MSYIILKSRLCDITLLNVHASTDNKTGDTKDTFYEELERVFYEFPKYHMNVLLGDFNAKVARQYIFKRRVWNESLHEISNHN
jgi:hypothetical protein